MRLLTVKLKFEIEEEGGHSTALLRVPGRIAGDEMVKGEGEDAGKAILNLLMCLTDQHTEFLLLGAVLIAAHEAELAALWTP